MPKLVTVNTAHTIAANSTPLATVLRVASNSPAPYFWLVRTVNPVAIPLARPITRNIMVPVDPTAASALAPTNLPTMTVSTMLYSCWKVLPNNKGHMKFKINLRGFPCVIFVSIDTY